MSFLCSLPLAASLFAACAAPPPLAVGYVEGEYVSLAATENAEVREVLVRRGDMVEAGQPLAKLEDRDAEIAVEQSQAALAQARAQLADLKRGKRPEELAVLEAALRSAKAEAEESQRVFNRTQDLHNRGIATQADLDRAATQVTMAEAAVGRAEADLEVARLPAREETIEAAQHQVEQSHAALQQAKWRLSKRTITAPEDGQVSDVIRNAGDLSGPQAPVISLLPENAVKLKLYVPEEKFSTIQIGDRLAVSCDGCPDGLTAVVSYASPEPEFTPPVIYSLETRQKLSHLIEARPEGKAEPLKPGQIVDVRLMSGE
jgi:HlyD family secretion protein